jgi:hypothetical protein
MIKILDGISLLAIVFGKRLQEKVKGDGRFGRKKE